MTRTHSAFPNPADQAIRDRVLRAIAANRVPGLHFAGHFLDLRWREVTADTACMAMAAGPHCRDADGAVNLVALGILVDNILATPTRTEAVPGARLATIQIHLQFTGAPIAGDLAAEGRLVGRSEQALLRRELSAATISAAGTAVCHASGEFALLDAPPGVTLAPLPWQRHDPPPIAAVDAGKFSPGERAILKTCDAALAKASPQASFIQHLWGAPPRRSSQGAANRVAIGPHIGNRVGHVQGGALLGLAATTARAAAPAEMLPAAISAWYISPGRGAALSIRSRLLHAGRTLAVVRTEIKTASGERVLEAVSHHVARKTA
ncbi:MAG: acyl-CoA thioesterase domain-containing protein [Syntrophales bacterium]